MFVAYNYLINVKFYRQPPSAICRVFFKSYSIFWCYLKPVIHCMYRTNINDNKLMFSFNRDLQSKLWLSNFDNRSMVNESSIVYDICIVPQVWRWQFLWCEIWVKMTFASGCRQTIWNMRKELFFFWKKKDSDIKFVFSLYTANINSLIINYYMTIKFCTLTLWVYHHHSINKNSRI